MEKNDLHEQVKRVSGTTEYCSERLVRNSSVLVSGEEDGIKVFWVVIYLILLQMSCRTEGGTEEYA